MNKQILLTVIFGAFAILSTGVAQAAVVQSGVAQIGSEMKFVKLEVEAKCQTPRFEDDSFRVHFSAESYKEVESYRGYSMKLVGRTCGKTGPEELSTNRFEKVQVLLYNYGEARTSFDDQVRKVVEGL